MANGDDKKADAPAATAQPEAAAAPKQFVTLKMPEGTSSVSFQGIGLEVKNGLVRVEQWMVAHLKEAFGAIDAPSSKK